MTQPDFDKLPTVDENTGKPHGDPGTPPTDGKFQEQLTVVRQTKAKPPTNEKHDIYAPAQHPDDADKVPKDKIKDLSHLAQEDRREYEAGKPLPPHPSDIPIANDKTARREAAGQAHPQVGPGPKHPAP